jgi:hypothetical protein
MLPLVPLSPYKIHLLYQKTIYSRVIWRMIALSLTQDGGDEPDQSEDEDMQLRLAVEMSMRSYEEESMLSANGVKGNYMNEREEEVERGRAEEEVWLLRLAMVMSLETE